MISRIRRSLDEKEKGFTLIELLVVIIIIGILAAIAIPVFLNQRQKGWDAAIKSDLKNMATAEETVLTDSNSYADPDVAAGLTLLTTAGFKPSAASNYGTATAITGTPVAGDSYCLTAQSASTKFWTYKSDAGGLQTTSTAAQGC